MGRLEGTEVDGTMQQSDKPAAVEIVTQPDDHTSIQSQSDTDDSSKSHVVENPGIGNPWTTGLFDCHEHQTNAVMTAFLPCVTFGQIAEVLDEGEMPCHLGSFIYLLMMPALCSQWVMGSTYRAKLRQSYNLTEAPYTDVISHAFCPCCSLCQEFRELTNRGLHPALGWNGILAKKSEDKTEDMPPRTQAMFK